MAFEIGDKVLTRTGLYVSGEWREEGLKGKIVDKSNEFGGLLTVKFKGIDEHRFIRPEYLVLRKKAKAPEEENTPETRKFEVDDVVELQSDVVTVEGDFDSGETGVVLENIANSNLVVVDFEGDELTLAEEILAKVEPEDEDFEEEAVPDLHEVKDNPEVQAAFALVLERIEEIKALLTQGPRNEVVFNIHPSNGLTEEQVAEAVRAEEPAPEPVFKKAKEVKAGDLLYTEGGAYDRVDRIDVKASGYTSLYGAFDNRIAQVPSGRVVQVLEEVS